MARFCVILICLVTFLGTSSWAKSRDEELEEILKEEGFSDHQASVQALLLAIWDGNSWGEDVLLPYYNLERYAPYSAQISHQVLNLVRSALRVNRQNVNVDRLLQTFSSSPVSETSVVTKIASLLKIAKTDETRLVLARILARYPQTKAKAIETFHALLMQTTDRSMQIQVAYELLNLEAHVPVAEDTLLGFLKDRESAMSVLMIGSLRSSGRISDRLYGAIGEAFAWMPEAQRSGMLFRLRRQRSQTMLCETALAFSSSHAGTDARH